MLSLLFLACIETRWHVEVAGGVGGSATGGLDVRPLVRHLSQVFEVCQDFGCRTVLFYLPVLVCKA